MTTIVPAGVDVRVKEAVIRQLEWDPQVDTTGVAVLAGDGIVTLTGYIDTYAGKLAAERAAKRVRGVRGVANELQVRLKLERTDPETVADVVRALRLQSTIPESVQAVVHDGHVTLTGKVEWLFQKRDAERAVRHVRGVKHIFNHITVAPKALERDVRRRIVQALHRNASLDAGHLAVAVSGETAVLTGRVGTWLQRETAERAAADAPGIVDVDNRIYVEPPLPAPEDASDETC